MIPPDDVLFGDGFVELSAKRMVSRRANSDVTGTGVEPLRDGRAKNVTQRGVSAGICEQRFETEQAAGAESCRVRVRTPDHMINCFIWGLAERAFSRVTVFLFVKAMADR